MDWIRGRVNEWRMSHAGAVSRLNVHLPGGWRKVRWAV
jgi:hypothetical protein